MLEGSVGGIIQGFGGAQLAQPYKFRRKMRVFTVNSGCLGH